MESSKNCNRSNWEALYGVSAGKRDQIDKKIFFEITNILDQMIKSTSILLRNFFLKKNSIWSLFPALTPNVRGSSLDCELRIENEQLLCDTTLVLSRQPGHGEYKSSSTAQHDQCM